MHCRTQIQFLFHSVATESSDASFTPLEFDSQFTIYDFTIPTSESTIIGAAVGLIIFIMAILCLIWRCRSRKSLNPYGKFESQIGPQSGSVDGIETSQFAMYSLPKLYDPSDPSTFPTSIRPANAESPSLRQLQQHSKKDMSIVYGAPQDSKTSLQPGGSSTCIADSSAASERPRAYRGLPEV